MGEANETRLEAALDALARDVTQGTPAPSEALVERVMLDTALETFGREAMAATPRPGPDLVARVLADAATVSAENAPDWAPAEAGHSRAIARTSWFSGVLSWRGGAVAALSLCLSVGVGVGMELDPSDLPMMGDEQAVEMAIEGGILPEEFL